MQFCKLCCLSSICSFQNRGTKWWTETRKYWQNIGNLRNQMVPNLANVFHQVGSQRKFREELTRWKWLLYRIFGPLWTMYRVMQLFSLGVKMKVVQSSGCQTKLIQCEECKYPFQTSCETICLSAWRTLYLPVCLTDFLTSCGHSEQRCTVNEFSTR